MNDYFLLVVIVVALFWRDILSAIRHLLRKVCAHEHAAAFRYGPNEEHVMCHCFRCGCTRIDEGDWKDMGVRSGNELTELLAVADESATPDELPDSSLPLNDRVERMLENVVTMPGDEPNAILMGREELEEFFPILVAILEHEEQFRRATMLKSVGLDIDSPAFIGALQSVEIHGLKIVPTLEAPSLLALTHV